MFFLLEGALKKLLHKRQSTIFWSLHLKCQEFSTAFWILHPSTQVDCFQLEKYFYVGVSIADFKSMICANTILSTYQKLPIFSL